MIHLITNNTVYILMAVHSFVGKDRRRLLDHFFFLLQFGPRLLSVFKVQINYVPSGSWE